MKKIIIAVFFTLFLSACGSDRLAFSNRGEVYLLGNDLLCIKSKPGDVISFYSLSSSENKYYPALVSEFEINNKYPDTCIRVSLKKDVSYELIYTMNKVDYSAVFNLENDKLKQK
ncbi:putative T6SS immunity periplasmic lipoprotein [Rouxiella sp. Mn2063]|uniref:putative T6SS immunity periplasmic lipoprotein n=1 Tax=Rouxiella sp. Mn2063 TaxID=3395262 RepID=UPI003BB9F8AB